MLAARLPLHNLKHSELEHSTTDPLKDPQYLFKDAQNGLQSIFSSPHTPPLVHSSLLTPHFLHAVRTTLVQNICAQSLNLRPFKNGFLIRHSIYCHLQVHATPTHILIHPILIPTPFQPIPTHLKPGAPITLLPYTTPAYFISNYTGPTSAISNQFKAHGVDCNPHFVIAWVAVENKQGEDKGILIIYPTDLCLSSSFYRPPLDYIPELPHQLQQASPLAASISRPPILSSPTSDSIHAFRALTVNQSKHMRYVATEVGGYVDAVARERERERERLKRERESVSSPKTARPVSTPAPPAPNPPPPPPAPPLVSAQNFYPSPPQIPPPVHEARTSPVIENHPSPLLPPPPPQSATPQIPYDPWPSSSDSYLDIDMDFEIGMNFGANPTSGTIPNEPSNINGFDETAFTDDDFNFFDQPTKPPIVTPAISPAHFGDIISQPTWTTPSAFVDQFTTPRSIAIEEPPELVPSSPSPESPCFVPATPNVHLENDCVGTNAFEPITFSDYHKRADGKYAIGKFALLPSPPVEDGWKARYDAATDPRIGVVKKLIGVKRKILFDHEPRPPPVSDWEMKEEEVLSDLEEEDEEDEEEEDIDSPMLSRPATPPPSYLPLGPTLLQTRFQHSQLLPLSIPLRPPGAAVAPVGLSTTNAILASVPTPVSPAAMVGATSEKSRSLEAAGFAVAAEVVENPVWAESWRAATVGAKPGVRVWNADVKLVMKALESVKGCLGFGNGMEMEMPLSIEDLFGLDAGKGIKALEDPLLSIGKNDAAVDIKPTSLRFWEKLGLNPKSGPKDFTAFVLYEDDTGQKQPYLESWLAGVKNVYHGKHYGTVGIGKCPTTEDGLVPLRYDATFRKTLTNFITSLQPPQPTIVVFLVLPVTIMSLSSTVLRQVLSVAKKLLLVYTQNPSGSQLIFQLIPDSHIFCSLEASCSPPYDSPLDRIASSTYNKILVSVGRERTRVLYPQLNDKARKLLMGPSFTLARPVQQKVTFIRAAHTSLDVLDRHTLLHVGYHITACGKWMVACCVDERGDGYDLRVNLTSAEGSELSEEEYTEVVKKVWDFGMEFAKRANLEWRVVFARLGVMGEKEMNAWSTIFNENVASTRGQPPLHHYLVCVVPDTPWMFVPSTDIKHSLLTPTNSSSSRPTSSSSSNRSPTSTKQTSPTTIFTDISSTTYAIFPKSGIPISVPPSLDELGLSQTFVPEDPVSSDAGAESSPLPHPVALLSQTSSILIRVPHHASSSSTSMTHIHLLQTTHSASYTQFAQTTLSEAARVPSDQQTLEDVTRNYFDLAVLSREKWRLDGVGGHDGLPFHIAAVDAMRMALINTWDGVSD